MYIRKEKSSVQNYEGYAPRNNQTATIKEEEKLYCKSKTGPLQQGRTETVAKKAKHNRQDEGHPERIPKEQ